MFYGNLNCLFVVIRQFFREKKKKRCFQQSSSGYRNNNDNERINSIKKDKEKTESIKLRENSDEACNGKYFTFFCFVSS